MRIEPVFLFDLDGTLVDSVYRRIPVTAWKEALGRGGRQPLRLAHPSQDRHERRPLHRPAQTQNRSGTSAMTGFERLRHLHAEAYRRMSRLHPPTAGRSGIIGLAHECRPSLGDRHQWAHGDGVGEPRRAWRQIPLSLPS